MKTGLKLGARGADAEHLQRVLESIGHEIDRREMERHAFGPSTLEALQAFQARHGLRRTRQLNRATLELLLDFEQKITVNINESPAQPRTKKPDTHHGSASGKLVDEDGAAIAGARVSLFAKLLRSEKRLGHARTGKAGEYSIKFRRPATVNLVARAYNRADEVIAESATMFAAAAEVEIDLTTAKDGVVRQPSQLTLLQVKVAAQLGRTSLQDLQENKSAHDLQFLANSINASFYDVAYLFIGHKLALQYQLQDATLFGVFYEGIPAPLDAALSNLPDAGIDAVFITQAMSGVLTHSRASLSGALTAAVTANIIPASYAAMQEAELSKLDALRIQSTGKTPYIRGKTPLNDLLAASSVTDAVKTAFVQAYASSGGRLAPTWKALRANPNLAKADLTTLNTTLNVGELLGSNIPLVKDTLQRLSQGTLPIVRNLALLDQADWVVRITALDPQATSIPAVLPNETPEQRIARLAKALAERFASRYPAVAFAGGLTKATTSSFTTRNELIPFLTANSKLNFKRTNIDQFIATNKLAISSPARAELKTAQRLFRVSPHYATVEALNNAGFQSAQGVYFAGRSQFIGQMTPVLGSFALANAAYARAQTNYAAALATFGRYNLSLNGVATAATASPIPDPSTIANLPDLQALFGSLDHFECSDCRSVYSPAAYLVDLLQYLKQRGATGGIYANARDVLLARRLDLQYIALNCNNTDTTLPYIDVVNEILEAAVAPPAPPVTLIDTKGTSAERRAMPQQISADAYKLTSEAVFGLSLPFDLPFAQTAAYLAALGKPLSEIMRLLSGVTGTPTNAAVAGAILGINPEMQAVINGTDPHQPWERWGLAQNPISVIDPKNGELYSPNPVDWVAALGKVPVLLNRSGLSLLQLYQLLEVNWVTQSAVTLQIGTMPFAGVQVLDPDTDAMEFSGLDGNCLDRVNRFLRLWTITGLQMWELDWALDLAAGGVLDDKFLILLAGAMTVRTTLNLPFQEILSFWSPMGARDVTSHLDEQDTVIPSTYSEVFTNPTMLPSWSNVYLPANIAITAASNASPIVITTALPHGLETGMQVIIGGVVGNTGANGTFPVTVTSPTAFTLIGSTGNGAWTSGGIVIPNIAVPQVTNTSPIAITTASPHRLQTGMAVSITGVQGTTAANGTFTVSITSPTSFTLDGSSGNGDWTGGGTVIPRIAVTAASNGTPITITTAGPHGLQTGMLVALDGVTGNTAANGTFSITVPPGPNANSFTLDGSIGNGNWTGGGFVAGTLSGAAIIQASPSAPATAQSIILNAIMAALALSAEDIKAILNFTGAQNTLTLDTLNALFRYARLATAQSLDIPDLILWIQLTAAAPFGGSADDTIEFLRRLAVLQGTGLAAQDLDYLLRGGSVSQSALAFTASQVGATLQSVRDALAKLVPKSQLAVIAATSTPAVAVAGASTTLPLAVVGATNESPIVITTSSPHGLQNGMRVSISGVAGNLAANSVFAVTIIDATNFSLNGSYGSGDWTSGGTVTAEIMITTAAPHGLQSGMRVSISGVLGNTAANGVFPVTVIDSLNFDLNGSSGNGIWTSGGTVTAEIMITTAAPHGLQSGMQVSISGVQGNTNANGTFTINVANLSSFNLAGTNGNAAWTSGGIVTPVVPIVGAANPTPLTVSGATNATPVVITTNSPHGLQTGMQVTISGVLGNTAANGIFTVSVIDAANFSLNGSIGNGAWTSGGTVVPNIITIQTASPHGLQTGMQVSISGVLGNTAANGTFTVTVIDAKTFILDGGCGNGIWTAGGTVSTGIALTIQTILVGTLATATGVTADIISPALVATGAVPLGSDNISLLLVETSGVDPSQFTQLVNAFTAVSKASALYTALQPTALEFAFLIANAGVFNWLNPGALPVTQISASPYAAFEALLRALKLDQKQSALTPKLFDVLGQWLQLLPTDVPTAITSAGSFAPALTSTTQGALAFALEASNADLTAIATAFNAQAPSLTAANQPGSLCDMAMLAAIADAIDLLARFGISGATFVQLAATPPTPDSANAARGAFQSQYAQNAWFAAMQPVEDPLREQRRDALVAYLLGQQPFTITGASNASPIAISTAMPHRLQSGMQVSISGAQGNTAANGTFTITLTSPITFTLNGSNGNAPWTGGGIVTVNGTVTGASNLPSVSVTGASNTAAVSQTGVVNPAPIEITTASAHGLQTGMQVSITGVLGNTAANGRFTVTVMGATTFTLNGSGGSGNWTGGGTIVPNILITTASPHDLKTGMQVSITGAHGNTAANGNFTVTVASATTFSLDGTGGNGNWTGGGIVAFTMSSPFLTVDDIFDYYLMDPEMNAAALTTRLLHASLTIQQFVQQCFLDLVPEVKVDAITDIGWNEWSFMREFRLWQFNRQVFLYPENYPLTQLKTDKSSFFTDLENDLRQSNCDADAVEAAFESYLRKLVEVSRLVIKAHYHETKADGSRVLHVFAHTRGTPHKWYYRTRAEVSLGSGIWSAWESLNLDIASEHLIPVVWDRRLHLVWPIFKQISEKESDQSIPSSPGGGKAPAPQKFWAVEFAMSELSAGQWQAKRTISEKMFLFKTGPTSITLNKQKGSPTFSGQADRPALAFTFQLSQDQSFNLQIDVYFNVTNGELGAGFPPTVQVAEGTLSMPEAPLSVVEDPDFLPASNLVDPSQEPTYALVATDPNNSLNGQLATPTQFGFSGQTLISGNVWTRKLGSVTLYVLCQTAATGQPTSTPLLTSITNPEIVIPQQERTFNSEDPFFIADPSRVFFVQPHFYTVSSRPAGNRSHQLYPPMVHQFCLRPVLPSFCQNLFARA